MAAAAIPCPAPALQPGLRSFIIYDHLPDGCEVFEVTDGRAHPHICAGEFAIFDPADTDPMHGEMFLMEWDSGRRGLVELGRRILVTDSGDAAACWTAHWAMALAPIKTGTAVTERWGDGPYLASGIAPKLRGRVVGIYKPDFRPRLSAS